MNFLKTLFLAFFLTFVGMNAHAIEYKQNYGGMKFEYYMTTVDWMQSKSYGKKALSRKEAELILKHVNHYSELRGLDPKLVLSIIATESEFRKGVKSKGNARGLMQVIPYWHKDKIRGRNIYDIQTNIDVGTQILAEYKKRAKGDEHRALAMYKGWTGKTVYIKRIMAHIKSFDRVMFT